MGDACSQLGVEPEIHRTPDQYPGGHKHGERCLVPLNGDGGLAEVQGTAEGNTFSRDQLSTMLDLAFGCNASLVDIQKRAIETPLSEDLVRVTI